METIKVKPWGKGQGDHVLINAADFDPSKHTRHDPEREAAEAKAAAERAESERQEQARRDAAAAEANAARAAVEREAAARAEAAKANDAKPDEGDDKDDGDGKMGIAAIREALTAKGITFDPKAKKADLRALLDAAA